MKRLVGCLVVVLGMASAARATTLIPLDLDQLARHADAIVIARCDEVASGRLEQQGARAGQPAVLRTQARFTRLDTWKGAPPAELRVVQVGGSDGRYSALVPGGASFEPGAESVLFLQDFRDGTWGVIGLFQGKLDLVHAADGELRVSRAAGITESGDATPAGSGAIEMMRLRDVADDGSVSIDSFHEQVQAATARAKEGAR